MAVTGCVVTDASAGGQREPRVRPWSAPRVRGRSPRDQPGGRILDQLAYETSSAVELRVDGHPQGTDMRPIVGSWLLVVPLLNACLPAPIIHVAAAGDPRAADDSAERVRAIPAVATRLDDVRGAPGRNLILFFDGTNSGPLERSNVYKLHEMVVAEGRPDVLSFYVEGVGVGFKPIGSATGWGIDYRLKSAYAFLLEHHRRGDRVHLFGFSRGAFAARILAAMLYFAGLPEEPATVCPASQADANARDGPLSGSDCLWEVSELVYS